MSVLLPMSEWGLSLQVNLVFMKGDGLTALATEAFSLFTGKAQHRQAVMQARPKDLSNVPLP